MSRIVSKDIVPNGDFLQHGASLRKLVRGDYDEHGRREGRPPAAGADREMLGMIYYVIPRELAEEYYEEFKKRFEGVEGVEVIIDRRQGERRQGQGSGGGQRRRRDRRRQRMPGTFPEL
jgi:hypothetical protein